MQLWSHESQRVFYDRLVDEHDRNWFINNMQTQLKENLDCEMENDELINLLFGDYGNSYKEYMKIEDPDTLV
jgi:dynein heavy chain